METLTVKETRGAYAIHHNDRPIARMNSLESENVILCYAAREEAEKQANILMAGGGRDGIIYYSIPCYEWWWEETSYGSNQQSLASIEILYGISKLKVS